jgi:nucleoside-diphosphate-sugar epimerase
VARNKEWRVKVLVTGAAGYLGCRLVRKLADRGDYVTAVDRFYFGRDGLPQHPGLTWVERDVREVDSLPIGGIDAIISLAAASSDAAASAFPAEAVDIGAVARERLALRARAAGVRRFVLPSSSNVYGPSEDPVTEATATALGKMSLYPSICLDAERRLLPLTTGDFDVVVLRQATLHGWSPKIRFDLAVNNLVRFAMAGLPLPVAGDGNQRRPFLHIDDAADVHAAVLDAPSAVVGGRIFNVAAPADAVPVSMVAAMVHERLGNTGVQFYGGRDELSHCVNADAVYDAIGWKASRGLAESVDKVAVRLRQDASVAADRRTNRCRWLTEIGGFA